MADYALGAFKRQLLVIVETADSCVCDVLRYVNHCVHCRHDSNSAPLKGNVRCPLTDVTLFTDTHAQ